MVEKLDLPQLESEAEEFTKTGPRLGVRHIICTFLFMLLAIGYGMRVNLSVAIVAMTDNTTTSNPDIPTYDWDDKSVVLSSFFWGYICLQVLAGQLGRTYGIKWFLVGAMLINSAACMLIPLLADTLGSKGVMGCRVVQGMSQGFFYPSVHALLGQWAPAPERSTLGMIVFAGVAFGTIITYPVTGFISASWIGWPPTFYLFGALGCTWALLWAIFGANRPSEHIKISEEERNYIESTLGTKEDTHSAPTPWKEIFTSWPAWAAFIGSYGQNWGYSTLLTEMPNYMNKVMKFDMHSNSLLSAAPYLALFLISFLFGSISDYLINHNYLSRGNARKVFNTIGTFVPSAALITLGFLPEDDTTLSVVMLIIAVGVNAAVWCGFQINIVDLSPKFSGVLMGIANGSSAAFSIIAPLVVQVVVTDETDKNLWRTIFLVAASIYMASDVFFVFFASGEIQWWDAVGDEKIQLEKEQKRRKEEKLAE